MDRASSQAGSFDDFSDDKQIVGLARRVREASSAVNHHGFVFGNTLNIGTACAGRSTPPTSTLRSFSAYVSNRRVAFGTIPFPFAQVQARQLRDVSNIEIGRCWHGYSQPIL